MQISNWRARLVLMLRPILAQPFLPLFPPSYPLPNRICRILQSHFLRRQECQNTSPGACWDMHPTFPQTYRKKSQTCCSCTHLISTWCVVTAFSVNGMYAPDVLQTHTDSLLKLGCLVNPAQFVQSVRQFTACNFKVSFIRFNPQLLFRKKFF